MSSHREMQKPILFVLSIDTEEEWDWNEDFPQKDANVSNIDKIPSFQRICENLGIRPTYFIDYAVADNKQAVEKILPLIPKGNCEIGGHLHPWCNPPYFDPVGEFESHVVNLPKEQVSQKLENLVQKLKQSFDIQPKSFRTGRWGIDKKVMSLLVEQGFNVDSSVYPFYENEYFHCNGAPSLPYWPDLNNPLQESSQNKIYELPVTVGFNRSNFELANKIHTAFTKPLLSWTRFNGIAWHTNILRKNYLCPELSTPNDMISLCKSVIDKGYPILHMYMHSSSLVDNNNSLHGNKDAFSFITNAIKKVVGKLSTQYNIEFCTISEAAQKMQARAPIKGNSTE
ncbi:polysaccharide deacetylase family protein [Paraglaciecola sp. 2405UD69-4]|uniref:polysaccharide deacetylase family protein n=1 Tax=Paraglaciecola sp. 2405UD69-4 TaxID=3391836 RepID=UPI0039C962AD